MHGIILAAAVSLLPPAEYDHAPKQRMNVFTVNRARIARFCGPEAIACAFPLGKYCVVFLPDWRTGYSRQDLYRHERSHCNGWRH